MGKRVLSKAELEQRRNAAKNAGRPAKTYGTRAARRAVARARELGQSAQVMAVLNLIAGARGLLPPDTAAQIIECSEQLLSRWGNPTLKQTQEVGKVGGDTVINLGGGAELPPPVEPTPSS